MAAPTSDAGVQKKPCQGSAVHTWRHDALRERVNRSSLSSLLEQDLDFTLHHFQEPCFDLVE
jgi:hypothetical protein